LRDGQPPGCARLAPLLCAGFATPLCAGLAPPQQVMTARKRTRPASTRS
jgi:hypothetical protein